MDIKKIKSVANSDLPLELKEFKIISILSKDKNVIPLIMNMLEIERNDKSELIDDMNLELSRAHIYIDSNEESKKGEKKPFNKGFVLDKISEFYIRSRGVLTHCFNRFNQLN